MAVTINRLSDFIRRQRSARTSVILPFLIIAIAFGALGYRSWELSGRMERGLDSLAVQYLEYTAEITARRADAATQAEIYRASEEWQQIERLSGGSPQFGSLAEWVKQNKWILSAIYVPDSDPTNSIFHSELTDPKTVGERLSGEFFTASGSVRYTYSPGRLLDEVRPAINREAVAREGHTYESRELREQAHVAVVPASTGSGLVRGEQGFTVFVSLAPPLEKFAVAASIETDLVREGWQSHRVISIVFSVVAIGLLTVGAWLAIRGLRKENEAMQLRAALIANVSHELRTPLAMIRLAAETLQRGSDRLSAKDRSDMQESILREVLHLSHLVENVLDVARGCRKGQSGWRSCRWIPRRSSRP